MKYLFCIALLVTSYSNYAQMSINDRIEKQIDLKTIDHNGLNIISTFKNIEPKQNILDCKSYFGYVFSHFRDENIKTLEPLEDESKKEAAFKNYRQRLKNDSLFVNTLKQISINSSKPIEEKPVYSFDDVLDIATKFIKITKLDKDENYVLKICSGVSDIEETFLKRHADIEAFCFVTIFNSYTSGDEILKNEIYNEFYKIVPLSMGIEKEKRILRAQGALMVLMYQNESFKQAILNEYAEKKEILPFTINLPKE
ncbi:MAG: hypothetical protein RSE50_10760 [Myroides sp.]